MSDESVDRELQAISAVLSALKDLSEAERSRVISYVLTRLEISTAIKSETSSRLDQERDSSKEKWSPAEKGPSRPKDIRTLADEKKPRSANEMAALVAYYLQYEADPAEKKDTISRADVDKYFHLAKFRKPKDATFTLVNSRNAGYLDSRERGTYSLNPVGYNLVVHKMPRKVD